MVFPMVTEFKYEIVERIAVLSQSSKGWTKELNLVSWNERDPKYDVREWSPDGTKMGKGITLSNDEAAMLKKALDGRTDI
ncbi:MAG: YdbC family protein [Methanomethylophilus sp.]